MVSGFQCKLHTRKRTSNDKNAINMSVQLLFVLLYCDRIVNPLSTELFEDFYVRGTDGQQAEQKSPVINK